MTFREIVRLALGIGSPYADREPDNDETFAPPPPMPTDDDVDAVVQRACNGDGAAQRELGTLFYRGRGVPKDLPEAFKWLTLAVRQGDLQAEKFLEMVGPTLSAEDAYEGRRRIAEVTGEPLPAPDPEWKPSEGFTPAPERNAPGGFAAWPDQPLDFPTGAGVEAGATNAGGVPEVGEIPPPPIMLEPVPVGRRGWLVALAACIVIGGLATGAYFYFVRSVGTKVRPVTVEQMPGSPVPVRATISPEEIERLQAAADKGDNEAQTRLGVAFERGDGVPLNLATATNLYLRAAAAGNHEAEFRLGSISERGYGVPRDLATAAEWFRKAADAGNYEAEFRLGAMAERGLGVPKDFAAAANWYRKAAEGGHAGGEFGLGSLHERGDGVPQDFTAAAAWYRKSAEQGDSRALNNLGVLYIKGNGVKADFIEAYKWIYLATKRGNRDAGRNRDQLTLFMKAEQIAEALKKATVIENQFADKQ